MLISILVNFVPIIIAIVLHEVAHGYAAYLLGDDTAKRYRRLSLNPVRHVDVFGTLILPTLLILSKTGLVFGWAKPVPVDFSRLRNPRRDTLIVAAAGIITNIFLAALSALALHWVAGLDNSIGKSIASLFLINMVAFNIVLAVFNALPIPPLDGSKILLGWSDNPKVQKFLDSSKDVASRVVPGVTTRITSLLTRPFAFLGSSTCSQIATLWPFSISRLIYVSAA